MSPRGTGQSQSDNGDKDAVLGELLFIPACGLWGQQWGPSATVVEEAQG